MASSLGSLDLEFPETSGHRSLPPLIPLAEFVGRNKQLREWFPQGIPSAEERWQARKVEEFRL
jgi:hypothetical protein